MAVSQLTEQLDNLYTSTWQKMQSTVRDQIFDSMPFYFWLKDKGKLEPVEGGRFLTEPLQYAKNDNVQWIGKGGTVPLNDFEFLTIAQYDWKYLTGSIVRFGQDDQQNRGNAQIIPLVTSKLENTRNALSSELEESLAAGAATGSEIDGLQHLVADDPSTSTTIGGINQANYDWWRNQSKDMTGSSFGTNGVANMRTMLNDCQNNLKMDRPDIIVTGQDPYEYYEDTLLDYYRIQNNKLGDAGFMNQVFKGIPMIWSPSIGERMYFLNTDFLKMKYDPMLNFEMTELATSVQYKSQLINGERPTIH